MWYDFSKRKWKGRPEKKRGTSKEHFGTEESAKKKKSRANQR